MDEIEVLSIPGSTAFVIEDVVNTNIIGKNAVQRITICKAAAKVYVHYADGKESTYHNVTKVSY